MFKFTISPLRSEDIETCVQIYFTSFSTNTHSLACWPRNTPTVTAWWTNMFESELHEAGSHWLKAVSKETGDIAGYCKWQESSIAEEWKPNGIEWPEGSDKALCEQTFGDWARERKRVMGEREHWYLEMIATDPKYQGQGAGSAMLRWGLEQADQSGQEAYLESSPDALAVYEKFGFEEVSNLDTLIENERVKGEWYREVFMLRPAKSRATSS